MHLLIFILLFFPLAANERFPAPSKEEVVFATQKAYDLGKEEIFSLPYIDMAKYVMGRYYYGLQEPFTAYGCNPEKILNPNLPAVLFIHASESNQGAWLPLLSTLKDRKDFYMFSHNHRDERALQDLIHKIEKIRALYFKAGADSVTLYLVGHSLGGIVAVAYSFDDALAVPGITVEKVIAIASPMRNKEPPTAWPLYAYTYTELEAIDQLAKKREKNPGKVKLYTLAAENDWLLPKECALAGDEQAVIPSCGHVLAPQHKTTFHYVAKWLSPRYRD
jgi:predicted alpha/beta hydrolase family esterase